MMRFDASASIGAGSLLGAALILGGCGKVADVGVLSPVHGEITEWFSEPAQTRLRKTYMVSMPLDGRIDRIDLEPGDPVSVGQILVAFDRVPAEQALIEAQARVAELEHQLVVIRYDAIEQTVRIEAQATIDAARESLKAAGAQVEAERMRSARADKALQRVQRLAETQSVAEQHLEDSELEAETALIELRQQEFIHAAFATLLTAIKLGPRYVEQWLGRKRLQENVVAQQLRQARARLARTQHDLSLAEVRSPVTGVVLERYQQGDGTFAAGEPLLLIGNRQDLEVVSEVLTQDALSLELGAAVELRAATRAQSMAGRVERIEPAGFTKLSSLGVEQQRVKVIVSFDSSPAGLGVAYRLQARFFTGQRDGALIVPRFSVLQAPDGSHYVFKVASGRLQRQAVELGLRNDLELEVRSGLSESDRIVEAPDTTLVSGQRIRI